MLAFRNYGVDRVKAILDGLNSQHEEPILTYDVHTWNNDQKYQFIVYYNGKKSLDIRHDCATFIGKITEDEFMQLLHIFNLKPFTYNVRYKYDFTKCNMCRPYNHYGKKGLLFYNGKSYLNESRSDTDSCMYIYYEKVNTIHNILVNYSKRLLCIDFYGYRIEEFPYFELKLMELFKMKNLDKVIYVNYGQLDDEYIVTDRELPSEGQVISGHYTEYIINYFGIDRTNISVKSARN